MIARFVVFCLSFTRNSLIQSCTGSWGRLRGTSHLKGLRHEVPCHFQRLVGGSCHLRQWATAGECIVEGPELAVDVVEHDVRDSQQLAEDVAVQAVGHNDSAAAEQPAAAPHAGFGE